MRNKQYRVTLYRAQYYSRQVVVSAPNEETADDRAWDAVGPGLDKHWTLGDIESDTGMTEIERA